MDKTDDKTFYGWLWVPKPSILNKDFSVPFSYLHLLLTSQSR